MVIGTNFYMDIKKPDFFILGAAKAGTTTLYGFLSLHPKIFFSYIKETLFFSKDEYYQKGIDWYLKTFFADGTKDALWGEATPHYLYWAEKVAPRIKKTYPHEEPKLIIILRDPVSRAYSFYWNMVREGMEHLDFSQAIKHSNENLKANRDELFYSGVMNYGYLRGSKYLDQIECYFEYFNKDNFYFLLQEDLYDIRGQSIEGLFTFLSIPPLDIEFIPKANKSSISKNKKIHGLLNSTSTIKDIIKNILPLKARYRFRNKINSVNSEKFDYPEMEHDVKQSLKRYFLQDIEKLEEVIQRDLSSWKI